MKRNVCLPVNMLMNTGETIYECFYVIIGVHNHYMKLCSLEVVVIYKKEVSAVSTAYK